jgi:hypothetical protein
MFKNGQGLGGHMSRVHQGQSPSYEHKILVREARTFDRLMFKCAKMFHDKAYNIEGSQCQSSMQSENAKQAGAGSGHDNSFLDRAFIRRWKTKIYRYLEDEEKITQANFGVYDEHKITRMITERFKHDSIKPYKK